MASRYIKELRLNDRIKVGVKELNEFIEGRMLEHIQEKIPDMRRLLEEELRLCKDELNQLGRLPISSIRIALRDSQRIKEYLTEAYASFQPVFRRFTERMTNDIFDVEMEPLGLVDIEDSNKTLRKNTLAIKREPNPNDLKLHALALEVKKIGEDTRVMVNVSHAGAIAELKTWLKKFVHRLEDIMKKYIDDIFNSFYYDIFQPSLEKGATKQTKVLMRNLELLIGRDVIFNAMSNAMVYADYLVDSVRENTFTSNDHYLAETSKQLKDQIGRDLSFLQDSYLADITPHLHIVCDIRAFFKTRKKALPDAIQLHFKKALDDVYKETKKKIGDQMMEESSRNMIKESSRTIARRKFYLEREAKVNAALQQISLL